MNRRDFLATVPADVCAAILRGTPVAWFAGCSTPGFHLDAPFVSTPYAAVAEMLRLAQVGPRDVVYDLGCGDGRFVIMAAQRLGARGVGIDIDPQRIAEATAGARRAGVGGLVSFREEDLFKSDFSSATVVTLFLMTELNARLTPKLRGLKPGSRIVSYEYGIPGWEADEISLLHLDGQSHRLLLWRVG